eukprot:m51a1_g8349 hypothetical protein (87) ;mRNA; r:46385-46853
MGSWRLRQSSIFGHALFYTSIALFAYYSAWLWGSPWIEGETATRWWGLVFGPPAYAVLGPAVFLVLLVSAFALLFGLSLLSSAASS